MNRYAFVVLAGENRGKAREEELEDKNNTGRKYKTQFLDGNTKLDQMLCSGKNVLETTLDSITSSEVYDPEHSVMINHNKHYQGIGHIDQEGESLMDNILQSIEHVYSTGYDGKTAIICSDVPAIKSEDVDEFCRRADEREKNLVVGLSDIKEMMSLYSKIEDEETERPKKYGIRFNNDTGSYRRRTPHLTPGSIYLVDKRVYDMKDVLRENVNEILGMKRIFYDERNYEKICDMLKDDEQINRYPKTRTGMAWFALSESSFLKKVLISNVMTKAQFFDSVSISQLEEIVQKKVFDDMLSVGIERAPPRLGYDIDDENDITIADKMLKR